MKTKKILIAMLVMSGIMWPIGNKAYAQNLVKGQKMRKSDEYNDCCDILSVNINGRYCLLDPTSKVVTPLEYHC
ncbi:MAG: hypothetical protein K5864_05915, partial [Bacteroidales bacterium]|nr:hypothetical protein [Bacteroidales bacterium]